MNRYLSNRVTTEKPVTTMPVAELAERYESMRAVLPEFTPKTGMTDSTPFDTA